LNDSLQCKGSHGTHLPHFKQYLSHNAVNSGVITGLTVQVLWRLLWRGQHWLEGEGSLPSFVLLLQRYTFSLETIWSHHVEKIQNILYDFFSSIDILRPVDSLSHYRM